MDNQLWNKIVTILDEYSSIGKSTTTMRLYKIVVEEQRKAIIEASNIFDKVINNLEGNEDNASCDATESDIY